MRGSAEYISAGCNCAVGSADWGPNGTVAYGAGSSIALYKPTSVGATGIKSMLVGHSDSVNCVRWESGVTEPESRLVSGARDNTLIVWTRKNCEEEEAIFSIEARLEVHSAAVTCVDMVALVTGSFVCSGGADGALYMWTASATEYGSGSKKLPEWKLANDLKFGGGNALSVALSPLSLDDSHTVILAVGCDDTKIRLYTGSITDVFVQVIELSGHVDWVRSVCFTKSNSDLMLASGSQDTFVRLWRITRTSLVGKRFCISDLSLFSRNQI